LASLSALIADGFAAVFGGGVATVKRYSNFVVDWGKTLSTPFPKKKNFMRIKLNRALLNYLNSSLIFFIFVYGAKPKFNPK
jgi:hypothetical protein